MKIVPKNWREFQHYKDRNPPWIRLHRKLLDDKDFHKLPVESRALAPMLWLLASESMDGQINADLEDLAFRLRTDERSIKKALDPLLLRGFFEVVQDASTTLAPRPHVAVPETEALQSNTETEAEPASTAAPPRPKRKTPLPQDFGLSERVQQWARAEGYERLSEHLDAFRRKAQAKGYTYADWDSAFMEAVREDWAKLRGKPVPAGERTTRPSTEADRTAEYLRSQAMTPEQREAANEARERAMAAIKIVRTA